MMKSLLTFVACLLVAAIQTDAQTRNIAPQCRIVPSPGRCAASEKRRMWSFSSKIGACAELYGCYGIRDRNVFRTRAECARSCFITDTNDPSTNAYLDCEVNPSPGLCQESEKRAYYSYSSKTNTCIQIHGCYSLSDRNIFLTRGRCRSVCIINRPSNGPLPTIIPGIPETLPASTPPAEVGYEIARDCTVNPSAGVCLPSQKRNFFTYSSKSGSCVQIYGCYSVRDRNVFLSRDTCRSNCIIRDTTGPTPEWRRETQCYINPSPGRCNPSDRQSMWSFSTKTNDCQQIFGCYSVRDRNVFRTLNNCRDKCVGNKNDVTPPPIDLNIKIALECRINPSPGICADREKKRFFSYSSKTGDCDEIYGCYSIRDRNVYLTKPGCRRSCFLSEGSTHSGVMESQCYIVPSQGVCRPEERRNYYTFTTKTNTCVRIFGCYGIRDRNVFLTRTGCTQSCSGDITIQPVTPAVDFGIVEVVPLPDKYTIAPECRINPSPGVCQDSQKRNFYTYSSKTSSCVRIFGCYNIRDRNVFMRREGCRQRCYLPESVTPSGGMDRQCYLNPAPGRCPDSERRTYWSYNSKTMSCRQLYGCYSIRDRNVFLRKEGCERTCSSGVTTPEIPTLPPVPIRDVSLECRINPSPGRCREQDRRTYFTYSTKTHRCTEIYGCYSIRDRNVFLTRELCRQGCFKTDSPPNVDAQCSINPSPGNCAENQRRNYYSYSSKTSSCVQIYGCYSVRDRNVFLTRAGCRRNCVLPKITPTSDPVGPNSQTNFVDVRNGERTNMVDVRNGGGTSNMVDVRNDRRMNNMVDVRNGGATSNMVDVRNDRRTNMVDVRNDRRTNMVDVRNGGATSNMVDVRNDRRTNMVDARNGGATSNMVDVRNDRRTNMVDVRNGGATSNMVDVRNDRRTNMVDVRNGGATSNMVDVRNDRRTNMVDVRTGGATSNMVDVRNGGGTSNMVDVRNDRRTNMVDVRNGGATSNMVDVRNDRRTNMVDVRTSGATSNMIDVRNGGATSNMVDVRNDRRTNMVDVRNGGATSNMVDVRNDRRTNMVDVRTGGATSNMVDVRNDRRTNMVDVRNGGATSNMVDVRKDKRTNMVDVRNDGGASNMVDVRNGAGTKMVDVRSGGRANMVDVRTAGNVHDMTDIRRGGGLTMNDIRNGKTTMTDIRSSGSSSMVDVRNPVTNMIDVRRNAGSTMVDVRENGANMVDVRGNRVNMVDVRGNLGSPSRNVGSSNLVDVRNERTNMIDVRDKGISNMVDVRQGASGPLVDIRGDQAQTNLVDIRGGQNNANMIDVRGGTDVNLVDIRGGKINAGMVDVRGGKVNAGMVDIRGGRINAGIVDIRGGQTGNNMVDVRGAHTGSDMVDVRTGQTGSGMVDVRGGQTGSGMVDIRAAQTGSGMVDVRGGQTGSGMVDVRGGQTGSGMVDIRAAQTGSGMVDVRGGQAGSSMVDVRGGQTGSGMVDIRARQTGSGMVDVRGGQTGSGMVDVRGGQRGSGMVDIRAGQTGSGMVDVRGGQTGSGLVDIRAGQTGSGMVDVRGGQTGSGMVDIRARQTGSGMVDVRGGQTGSGMVDIRAGQTGSGMV
ncbi:uncharacterized protein LOC132752976 [Ruditapes philippinarum]|uniref:uncharacterized protein LOC132752976 n=1 Tax=Ruditapes philippinarum TaxID=129788 RepID=UPI00295B68E1|nr:uncharacterized protein LOC132752976 [Ruditapes philippinarum]